MCLRIITIAFAIFWAVVAHAQTGGRHALLIGNSNYAAAPRLSNPTNDANDMGAALARLGFEVSVATDLDGLELNRALADFSRKTRDAEIAILFFAGHGLEIDGQNYLLPVDAKINHVDDVAYEALRLDKFLHAIGNAKTLKLLLVDACRDNPFMRNVTGATRSLGRGLARVEPTGGVVVGYAARGGTVALDGDGRNSPYTQALLQYLEEPGLEVGKLFRRVRDSVFTNTNGRQEPFTYGSIPSSDIFIAGANPIDADFMEANLIGTEEAWDNFLNKYVRSSNTALIIAARKLRDAAREKEVPSVTPARESEQVAALPTADTASRLPTLLSPEEEEIRLGLSSEDRKNAQRLLLGLGYQPGTPDGVLGRNSRKAITEFQLEHGLPDNGFLNTETLSALKDVFKAAPLSNDGVWRLSFKRRPRSGPDAATVQFLGFVDIEITGRTVNVLKSANLTKAPSPRDPDLRATLSRNGSLEMSVVVQYEFHRNDARRVAITANLPERTLVGQVLEIPRRAISSKYFLMPELRRVSME